jgi:dTDP-4-amino-4,6-dideoxygalactose transaminase
LEGRGILRTPKSPKGYRHIYQSYVVTLIKNINRDKVRIKLRENGIETQIGTYCIPQLDFYKKTVNPALSLFRNASSSFQNSLTLPLYHDLEKYDQEIIIKRLNEVLGKCAV